MIITESRLLDRKVLKDGHKIDQSLLWMVVLMTAFSMLMIYSASIAEAATNGVHSFHYVIRQMAFVSIGVMCAVSASLVSMAKWQRMTPMILTISFVALILVLVLGRNIKGATRWIDLGPVNLQPTEIYKLAIILYLSSFFTRRAEVLTNIKRMIAPGVLAGLGFGLILKQPDFGSFMVVCFVTLGLLFLAGLPWKWFMAMVAASIVGAAMLVIFEPYRMKRVLGFLNPWEDPYGKGYQLTHSLMALARGEWTGVGLGASVEKRGFLPEAHTDFILAIVGEEFGFLGVLLLIVCYAWIVWRALTIAKQARDLELFFGSFVAQGIALWLGMQSFINIGVNIGLLPTKGLTLPLMSYGGSSVIMALISMALLLRVDYENRCRMRGFNVDTAVQKKH